MVGRRRVDLYEQLVVITRPAFVRFCEPVRTLRPVVAESSSMILSCTGRRGHRDSGVLQSLLRLRWIQDLLADLIHHRAFSVVTF